MDTDTEFQIVGVGPITFETTIKAATRSGVEEGKSDLKRRYPCIEDVSALRSYDLGDIMVSDVRLTMEKEADYQQICALRAELFGKCV